MRIGLVVDSGCDLPEDFMQEHGIQLLPIAIRLGEDSLVDAHDPQAAMEFYRNEIGSRGADAETTAYTTDQITELFLGRLVGEYDYVFCETVMRSRSRIFENATKASFRILSGYRPSREEAGCDSPFAMRVVDTGTLFTGQGVIAAETARLIASGASANKIRSRIDGMVQAVQAYAVPQDVYYLRARARRKGDRSLGLLGAVFASTFDVKPILVGHRNTTEAIARVRGFQEATERVLGNVRRQVEAGLDAPFVCLSYAGDLKLMRVLPGYPELAEACSQRGVTLLESVMSVTGGINLGPGTLTVAMLAKGHEFT